MVKYRVFLQLYYSCKNVCPEMLGMPTSLDVNNKHVQDVNNKH